MSYELLDKRAGARPRMDALDAAAAPKGAGTDAKTAQLKQVDYATGSAMLSPNGSKGGAAGGPVTYRVKPGDTLSGIAARVLGEADRWRELATLNGIANPRALQVGQTLKLPADCSCPAPTGPTNRPVELPEAPRPAAALTHTVRAGETLSRIAEIHLGDADRWREIADANGIADPRALQAGQTLKVPGAVASPKPEAPAPTPKPPQTSTVRYTVRSRDTLSAIAQVFYGDHTRWREIAKANGLSNPGALRVGQVLTIPNASGPVQAPTNPTPRPTPSRPTPGDDTELAAGDTIALEGLGSLDRAMAEIYNTKGQYLKQAASMLGIDTASAAAVLKVESAGAGFGSDGRLKIRFENHIFYDGWGKSNPATFNAHFKYNPDKRWTGHKFRADANGAWRTMHTSQDMEHEVLEFARGLHDEKALQAISMGIAQVMGFNHHMLGYESAREMYDIFSGALRPQLDGMFEFIKQHPGCMNGLQSKNYVQFAACYNGSGQAATYGEWIRQAAASYARVTRGRQFA